MIKGVEMVVHDRQYNLDKTQQEVEEINDLLDFFAQEMLNYKTHPILSTAGLYMNKIDVKKIDGKLIKDAFSKFIESHRDWAEKHDGQMNIIIVTAKVKADEVGDV